MPISKDRISSPLEAGHSVLDSNQLPPQIVTALEYVSSRLACKALSLSLVVVPMDIEVPIIPSPTLPPSPGRSLSTASAKSILSSASSTLTRSLTKRSVNSSMSDSTSSISSLASSSPSPTFSPTSTFPKSTKPNPFGISLIHASTLTPKAEKTLRHIISKAEKKYPIGSEWLLQQEITNSSSRQATDELIRRSITQNAILFSSEGLTLLALDRVYTFKYRLHVYSNSLSTGALATAVDELRRLVIVRGGRSLPRGYLMRVYDWLGVSLPALLDVNECYKAAYFEQGRWGGIAIQNEEKRSPPPLKTNFSLREIKDMEMANSGRGSATESERMVLKALLVDGNIAEEKRSFVEEVREDRGPHRRGAVTPKGHDDISPVTQGEWGFLMISDGWKSGRRAAVETF